MKEALGFIEITGVVAAVDALDIMCKTSAVELVTWERKLGGRLVTIIVTGSVSQVTEAVEAASKNAIKKPVCSAVIANPHQEIWKMVERSRKVHFGKKEKTSSELIPSDISEK